LDIFLNARTTTPYNLFGKDNDNLTAGSVLLLFCLPEQSEHYLSTHFWSHLEKQLAISTFIPCQNLLRLS